MLGLLHADLMGTSPRRKWFFFSRTNRAAGAGAGAEAVAAAKRDGSGNGRRSGAGGSATASSDGSSHGRRAVASGSADGSHRSRAEAAKSALLNSFGRILPGRTSATKIERPSSPHSPTAPPSPAASQRSVASEKRTSPSAVANGRAKVPLDAGTAAGPADGGVNGTAGIGGAVDGAAAGDGAAGNGSPLAFGDPQKDFSNAVERLLSPSSSSSSSVFDLRSPSPPAALGAAGVPKPEDIKPERSPSRVSPEIPAVGASLLAPGQMISGGTPLVAAEPTLRIMEPVQHSVDLATPEVGDVNALEAGRAPASGMKLDASV